MAVPTNLKYTAEHEWLLMDGDTATVGITAYAADALGDVVYLDLPAVGATITAGEACGEIESTKSVSDLFAPANGEVTEINQDAVNDPSVLNLDPFERGWLFRMKLAGDVDVLEPAAYESLIAGK
ncbi:glycine cleavage system protein GcvH [Dactylosporangium fulvum]|uniref:Glycine cleavage system H protein n=1 Tax=Dactylosporangium fulvum TaxID=53359 RepID=A0ABY5WAX6_9ACTN|nr:glycine cleavage system protein GcvH [Dactylosporangium fulvum]UWP86436.1 glycine cleavage system protein GcvH [Dactylosporangium fulvum]